MRDRHRIPDLTFADLKFGAREIPWDLRILLYKGGAAARTDEVAQLITCGKLGDALLHRLELVNKLHGEISAALSGGGSRDTAYAQFKGLRNLFAFADRTGHPLTVEEATETYCAWADYLFHRTRIRTTAARKKSNLDNHQITIRTAYGQAACVGTIIDRALERHSSVVEMTRLRWPGQKKAASGIQSEKQSLTDTFEFGHLLQDICDGLTIETVLKGPLPVQIILRSGKKLIRGGDKFGATHMQEGGAELRERYPLVNLRIEAEMHMFIGQTGMNVKQANNLELRHFSYISHLDSYCVKDRKTRRGGTVLFEIFRNYKPHFERYLAWRRHIFPQARKLFPFVQMKGTRPDSISQGHRLREICRNLNATYVAPRFLRNTRVNWLLRKSADPDVTAELAQHTKETLLQTYEQPSLGRAIVESATFWARVDPHATKTQPVAPGTCTGSPRPDRVIPIGAPKPDCAKASGCLWCESHRDVDSPDYVWALTSFGYLKSIEVSRAQMPGQGDKQSPALLALKRIQEKLTWFSQSNESRRIWVTEAQTRIMEGAYHPGFQVHIEELETSS